MLAILLPTAGAFVLPVIGRFSTKARNAIALLLVTASFGASLSLLGPVLSDKITTFSLAMPLGFDMIFTADALGILMALAASFVGIIIVLYSFGYIHHDSNQNEYYLMVVLFLGSMIGLVYSQNLIFIYLFWEIAAICCWRLIGFYREREIVFKSRQSLSGYCVWRFSHVIGVHYFR